MKHDLEPYDENAVRRARLVGGLFGACGMTIVTAIAGVAIIDTPEPCPEITPPIPIEITVPVWPCEPRPSDDYVPVVIEGDCVECQPCNCWLGGMLCTPTKSNEYGWLVDRPEEDTDGD